MSAIDTILNTLQNLIPSFAKSNGSIEAKIIDVVGTYADTEAIERQNTLDTINNALATQRITTKEYYRRKAVMFQIGDTLVYDPVNQGGYYDPANLENQIIKQSFVVGEYPTWTMLVNAIGSDGHLRRLSANELASFSTYFEAFEPLGLSFNKNSLDVAKISDPGIVIYVKAGSDAGKVAESINENLVAYESVLREDNTVSLTEIVDVIQRNQSVRAVGFDRPVATEMALDGTVQTTPPERGIFTLTNGAFTFDTEITTDHIKVLQ